ncbi:MAG: serine hydrolase domain-containing protein [Acidobacteriota bacterium]|nr:serine hydrolase domain-containing protein [Acidobacteriota bacterium]
MARPPSSRALIALTLAAACVWTCACATAGKDAPARLSPAERERVDAFRSDLEETRAELGMGRVTAAVVRDGLAEWTAALGGGDVSASFPLAELTETFTAVAALRLESRGRLRLDTPVADLDPSFPGPRTVLVRHLLSQTSEETPGTTFLFDRGAFARLTGILASASGTSFAALLEDEVLRPAELQTTQPTPGLTAATGLTSTVRDLARFEAALYGNRLLAPDALLRMTSPTFTPNGYLPYGLGWFVSWSANERMIWAFGESADASALFFRLPDRGLALILLAEGPALTRPFHLDLANPLRSPFVLAFLKRFVPLGEEARRLVAVDALVDRALVLQWKHDPAAAAAFRTALASRGALAVADPALLTALAQTTEPDLLAAGETIGRQVQAGGWDNARTLLDLAILQVHAGQSKRAAETLRGLLARPNVQSAPLLAEARRLLAETGESTRP